MADTIADPLIGRLIDGRYEVQERLARGGMGTVYRALDRRLERIVAVKVMHPDFGLGDPTELAARFRREAKAAARLTHPGLVRVYDQGTDGEISYLTMELVDGVSLRSRLERDRTISVGEALALTESVLDALAAVHRQGLVHRDVKPENVLVDADGIPKLADFGLARAVTEVTSTSAGTIFGTVAYLGPELVSRGQTDARTDVYAAGILLFEMITGRQPFTGSSPLDVAARHVHEDVPAPSSYVPWLPPEVDRLVLLLTARDPLDRPNDAMAALSALRQTRAMMDDPTLDRRAEPPSGAHPITRDSPTDVFPPTHVGATVALPVGLLAREDDGDQEDDPDAVEPEGDKPRIALWIGAAVCALVVMLGLGAWWYGTQGPGAYTTVPPVAGQKLADAKTILESAGLSWVVLTDFSDVVPEGLVISTSPGAQEEILKTDEVKITVSKGPRMEEVPPVVGILQEDAEALIDDAGFPLGVVTVTYSDTVPVGEVITQTPAAEELVKHDTAIDLLVSGGPAPITIADVTGLTEGEARQILGQDAMVITVVYEKTLDAPKGEVFKTDPSKGTASTRTASITVYVSDGKPTVKVPSFYGLTAEQAEDLAAASDLIIDWRKANNQPWTTKKYVADQDPGYNTEVEVGSTIILYYDS